MLHSQPMQRITPRRSAQQAHSHLQEYDDEQAEKTQYCATISHAFWWVIVIALLALGAGVGVFVHGLQKQQKCRQDYTLPNGGIAQYQDCRDEAWIWIVIGIAAGGLFVLLLFISCCAFMDCLCFRSCRRVPPKRRSSHPHVYYEEQQHLVLPRTQPQMVPLAVQHVPPLAIVPPPQQYLPQPQQNVQPQLHPHPIRSPQLQQTRSPQLQPTRSPQLQPIAHHVAAPAPAPAAPAPVVSPALPHPRAVYRPRPLPAAPLVAAQPTSSGTVFASSHAPVPLHQPADAPPTLGDLMSARPSRSGQPTPESLPPSARMPEPSAPMAVPLPPPAVVPPAIHLRPPSIPGGIVPAPDRPPRPSKTEITQAQSTIYNYE